MNDFGKFVLEYRARHGLLLYDMAKALDVGSAYLCSCERGKERIPDEWIKKLPALYPDLDKKKLRATIGFSNIGFITKEEIEQTLKEDPMPAFSLLKKWKQNYPLSGKSCTGDVYGCMFCGNCPSGEYWKCPEEDREEFEKCKADYAMWVDRHPCLPYAILGHWEMDISDNRKGELENASQV